DHEHPQGAERARSHDDRHGDARSTEGRADTPHRAAVRRPASELRTAAMLKHYLTLAIKVLLRRKFFTFISLFAISFTLLVLMVATAMLDHALAPEAPESRQDLTLSTRDAAMYGEHATWTSRGGFKLFDTYAKNLPGVERLSLFTGARTAQSFLNGQKVLSSIKSTDGEFWKILDFTFVEGAPYSIDDVAQARFVAVINR